MKLVQMHLMGIVGEDRGRRVFCALMSFCACVPDFSISLPTSPNAILMDTLVGTAVERDILKVALRTECFAKALIKILNKAIAPFMRARRKHNNKRENKRNIQDSALTLCARSSRGRRHKSQLQLHNPLLYQGEGLLHLQTGQMPQVEEPQLLLTGGSVVPQRRILVIGLVRVVPRLGLRYGERKSSTSCRKGKAREMGTDRAVVVDPVQRLKIPRDTEGAVDVQVAHRTHSKGEGQARPASWIGAGAPIQQSHQHALLSPLWCANGLVKTRQK